MPTENFSIGVFHFAQAAFAEQRSTLRKAVRCYNTTPLSYYVIKKIKNEFSY